MFNFPIKLSVILTTAFSPLCKDTYIIQIPETLDISEEGSIDISIIENDLGPYQTLHIDFDEDFIINDSHGKPSISGYTTGSSIIVEPNDTTAKTVAYHLPHVPAGSWSGNIGFSIRLDTAYPSNILIEGRRLNALLATYNPATVEFSNNAVSDYAASIDVSMAQDESVMLYWLDIQNKIIITNNENKPIIANEDMSELFKDIISLNEIINIDLLDFRECKNISQMFAGANRLSSISGLSDLDTGNIIDMSYLFARTNRFRTIDLSDWDVSNVKDMSYMFSSSYFSDFSSIENWNVANVEDMNNMFSSSRQVTSIDLSSWDVGKVTNMERMFYSGRNLVSVDLSSWNTRNCTDMSEMFAASQRLTDVIGISDLNTGNVTDMSSMFSTCIALSALDLSDWDVSKVEDMSQIFNSTNISSLGDLSLWDVANVVSFSGLFRSCQNLSDLSFVSDWNVSSKCQDLSMMFYATGSHLPSYLDLQGWDVSNVVNMSMMFYGCKSLEYLDISGWDTGNLINASGMFQYNTVTDYSALKNIIGIESIDTANLKNISSMFKLNRFINVDLSAWNTGSLEDISSAFSGCYRQDLDKLKHWNVSSVINMQDCFADSAGSLSGTTVPAWYIS